MTCRPRSRWWASRHPPASTTCVPPGRVVDVPFGAVEVAEFPGWVEPCSGVVVAVGSRFAEDDEDELPRTTAMMTNTTTMRPAATPPAI